MSDNKIDLKKNVSSGLFWTFSERILAQGVSFVVSIILARILLPENYGVVAIVVIAINILNVFVTSGLGSALIQKKEVDDLDYNTALYSGLMLSALLYLMIFFVSPLIMQFFDYPELSSLLRVLALKIPVSALNSVQQAYVSKKMIFKKFFFSTLIGTVISAVVGIVMAYKGFGAWALVFQYLSNTIIDTIVLLFILPWKPKIMYSFDRFKLLWGFGWKILLADLIQTLFDDLRSIAIGKKYSASDLAFYNRGNQLTNIIVVNVNTSITKVLFPAMSNSQDDVAKVKNITRRAIKVSSFVMSPLLIGLIVVATPLISLLLTDKWLDTVPYLQLLCLANLFMPIHTANLQAIKALGRSDISLKLEIIKKTYYIAVLAFTILCFDNPIAVVIGFTICTLVAVIINAFPNKKLLNYKVSEQFSDIFPNILQAVLMGVCVYFVSYLPIPLFLCLIIQILLGGVIYYFLSVVFKNSSFYYLKGIIVHFLKRDKL